MQTDTRSSTEARALDARIRHAYGRLARAEHELALLLAEMASSRHFLRLGYATVGQYAQARLQLEPRKTRGLVRLGRALPALPVLGRALAAGAISWTKARDLLTVITPETEAAWVERARRSTSRELEHAVAAHSPGQLPSDEATRASGPVRMSFSMEPVEAEQVRAALAALRAAAGVSRDEVEDGALLAQLAARTLHELDHDQAPTGERFRIVIEHCPSCGQTAAPDAEVSETHVGQACCDSEILEMREGHGRGHISRTIPPAVRRAVLQRDRHRCQVPGCTNRLWLDLHHLQYRREGGDNAERNLLTLCCTHHQLLHDGLLGISQEPQGLVFRFGDGRVLRTTHVGQGRDSDTRRLRGARQRTGSHDQRHTPPQHPREPRPAPANIPKTPRPGPNARSAIG